MDIEHKKTALDDDSILYQKRDESFEKKDLSGLSAGQKLVYFRDYYLKYVLIAAAVIAFAATFLYHSVFHRQETVISAAFVGNGYLQDTEGLEETLRDYYELTDKDQVIVLSNYNTDDYQQQMALTAIMAAGDLDLLICDQEYFESASRLGLLTELSSFLPADLYKSLDQDGKILSSSEVDTDNEGNVIRTYDPAPHGIALGSENAAYKAYGGYAEEPIIAVYANSKRAENAVRFIEWFLK